MLHFHRRRVLVIMAHEVGEKSHVVGHLHASGHNDGLTSKQAVPLHEGEQSIGQQDHTPFHSPSTKLHSPHGCLYQLL